MSLCGFVHISPNVETVQLQCRMSAHMPQSGSNSISILTFSANTNNILISRCKVCNKKTGIQTVRLSNVLRKWTLQTVRVVRSPANVPGACWVWHFWCHCNLGFFFFFFNYTSYDSHYASSTFTTRSVCGLVQPVIPVPPTDRLYMCRCNTAASLRHAVVNKKIARGCFSKCGGRAH